MSFGLPFTVPDVLRCGERCVGQLSLLWPPRGVWVAILPVGDDATIIVSCAPSGDLCTLLARPGFCETGLPISHLAPAFRHRLQAPTVLMLVSSASLSTRSHRSFWPRQRLQAIRRDRSWPVATPEICSCRPYLAPSADIVRPS